jgi:hypothetical protein
MIYPTDLIDISEYQNKIVWTALPKSLKAIYIRHSDGSYIDRLKDNHVAGAKSIGMPYGYYHFFRPLSKGALTEWKSCIAASKEANLVPVLDIEVPIPEVSIKPVISLLDKALSLAPCAIYTNPGWIWWLYKHDKSIVDVINKVPYFHSQYNLSGQINLLPGLNPPTLHQFRGNAYGVIPAGECNGIRGPVDLVRIVNQHKFASLWLNKS